MAILDRVVTCSSDSKRVQFNHIPSPDRQIPFSFFAINNRLNIQRIHYVQAPAKASPTQKRVHASPLQMMVAQQHNFAHSISHHWQSSRWIGMSFVIDLHYVLFQKTMLFSARKKTKLFCRRGFLASLRFPPSTLELYFCSAGPPNTSQQGL